MLRPEWILLSTLTIVCVAHVIGIFKVLALSSFKAAVDYTPSKSNGGSRGGTAVTYSQITMAKVIEWELLGGSQPGKVLLTGNVTHTREKAWLLGQGSHCHVTSSPSTVVCVRPLRLMTDSMS